MTRAVARRRPGAKPAARTGGGDPLVWLLLGVALAVWLVGTGDTWWRSSQWNPCIHLPADAILLGLSRLFRPPAESGHTAVGAGKALSIFGPFPAPLLLPLAL